MISKERASLYVTGVQLGGVTAFAGAYGLIAYTNDPWINQTLYVAAVCIGVGTLTHAVWRLVQYRRQRVKQAPSWERGDAE